MRIVFCWPAADFSIADVARGYLGALTRQGHDIREYHLSKRLLYHQRAIGGVYKENVAALSKQACETLVVEAMYHEADLVIIVSGLSFHPVGLVLLRKAGFPTAVIHTESPYHDADQAEWSACYPEMAVFTHDRWSAEQYGWGYLPHAFDPAVHYPRAAVEAEACDVLMIGTGFPERQTFLEQVEWTGIRLSLRGLWPGITGESPLAPCYREGCIANMQTPDLYASAAINLNLYRADPDAVSLNPRAYELAACGAFQISGFRADVPRIFGNSVPVCCTPAGLGDLTRYYLAHPEERQQLAAEACRRIQGETFDARAAYLMATLAQTTRAAAPLAASV